MKYRLENDNENPRLLRFSSNTLFSSRLSR